MSDITMYEQAIAQYAIVKSLMNGVSKININSCVHADVVDENGVVICTDCGEEIKRIIMHEKEWRYYGFSDTKRTSDPNRVQMRKSEDRNIYKDVENMGFSEKIVSKANSIYCDVTNGHIFRGNTRKSIIFACIYHAYKLDGKPQSHEKLIKIFSLKKKSGLYGIKYVKLNIDKESKIHTTNITPVHLVSDMMDRFSASDEQKQEVVLIYSKIKNKSSRLNSSRPQSISSGLIYYWVCTKNMNITLKEFANKVELSELTISKISKEISEIIGTTGLI
jgi:transcription initiation factor TFIIIB Brf1 subunit/transcription initiation factor TFIIB